MIVYYGSDHLYTKGYKTDGQDKYNRDGGGNIGEYRGGIKYLIYDNVKLGSNQSFMIKAGSQLEIHFSYPIQNLYSFFDAEYDNSEITSVDLSHFDCSKVKYIGYMFNGCAKLQVLNMSNINMTSIENAEKMFEGVSNLQYINIRSINAFEGFDGLLSGMNLNVCQSSPIIQGEKIINNCCFFYKDDISCKPNYMIVYYGSDHSYKNGYEKGDMDSKYREGINYLKYEDEIISPNKGFDIKAGSKLEIHFSYPIKNLENFFNATSDSSSIISVNLSHFDCSKVENISYMFYKSSALLVLDMSNIDMKNIINSQDIFNGTSNLKYLNIRGINNVPKGIFDLLSQRDLYVCQNTKIINGSQTKNDCCFFYEDSCNNYIN